MTQTELLPTEVVESTNDIAKINPNEAALVKMRDSFAGLTIKAPDDKAGIAAVATARLECKNARCLIESTRKELKQPLLDRGKMIDSEAKRLTAIIEPTEKRLISEETKAADWEAARKAEEARLAEVERRRKEQEERDRIHAEQKAENARLAEERAELARQQAEAKAAQDKIDAANRAEAQRLADERKAIEESRRKIEQAEEAERKRVAAAETARLAAEESANPKPVEPSEVITMHPDGHVTITNRPVETAKLWPHQEAMVKQAEKQTDFFTGLETLTGKTNANVVGASPDELSLDQRRIELDRKIEIRTATPAPNEIDLSPFLTEDRQKILTVAALVRGIDTPEMATIDGQRAAARVNEILERAAAEIRDVALLLAPPVAECSEAPF